jgi:CMP/dCMP kinase
MSEARPRGLIVAIDGPSGAGKSTAGRTLADRLGYLFIDTGAMYRALALKALRRGVGLDQADELAALARQTTIALLEGGRRVALDGEDVSAEIRTPDVTHASSRISTHPEVRRELVARQRELGRDGGVVLDGRDIGTAVFPEAEAKFYMDADASDRAARRHQELEAAGTSADLETVDREIRARDHLDSTRPDSPLTRAPDAVYLDTTRMGPTQVVERMLAVVEAKLASR